MMRLMNICVIAALVAAAAYVYKVKFESTRQVERIAKIRMEIRRERDAVAALRAQWASFDNPIRIQELASRHLKLQPIGPRQFDPLNGLPERPPQLVPPDSTDPIADLIDSAVTLDPPTASIPTASIPAARAKR